MAGHSTKRDAPTGSRPTAAQPPDQQMPGRAQQWIIGLVVACVVFGGTCVLRLALRQPATRIEIAVPTRPPPSFLTTPRARLRPQAAASVGFEGGSDDAAVARGGPGGTPEHRATPDAQPRAAVVPEPFSSGELPKTLGASTLRGALAQAVSLSVKFEGTTVPADSTEPLISDKVDLGSVSGSARFPPDAALVYPDAGSINLDEGSLAFWVRMEWDPDLPIEGKALAELRTGTFENRFVINMSARVVAFSLTNADGVEQAVVATVPWLPGDWHHVAATWGQGLMQLYVDGSLGDEHTYAGSVVLPPDTPLYVGSRRAGGEKQGTVSLRAWNVFQRVLGADEIADLMLQTAPPPA